jgi:hypothetical protein
MKKVLRKNLADFHLKNKMKKRALFFLFFLLLFLIPFLSAVSFDMKDNLMSGETLITKVSGYFFEPLIAENILLYRAHTRIPMQFQVLKIEDDYYVYADFTKRMWGNYSIIVQNTRHMSLTEETEEDFGQNFTITKEIASFSVNPGVIISSGDFSVEARNLIDREIELQIKINPEETQESEKGFFASLFGGGTEKTKNETPVTITPQQAKDIEFSKSSFDTELNFVEISFENLSYKIPVLISSPTEEQKEETEFRFEPTELNISLATDSQTSKIVYLYNPGKQEVKNISISLSNSMKGLITISPDYISELNNGTSIPIEISVLSQQEKKIIDGSIKAKVNEGTQLIAYSQIHLSFIPGYVANKTANIPTSLKTCAEISGLICQANLQCSGENIQASDGICCLGNCAAPTQNNNSGKIIGIIIFVIVLGLLVWFYLKKYKKKGKKEVNLLDIAKEGEGKK